MEVEPPLEIFSMFAYTAPPFSMLSDRINKIILLPGTNVAGLIVDLFYTLCIRSKLCFLLW
jgi:hypothetical protein